MDTLFIFGAKYLFVLPILIAIVSIAKMPQDKRKDALLFFCLSLPLTFLISIIARKMYFNPRPFTIENFTPLIPHLPDNGFPSDHTLLVSAIASGLMYFSKRKVAVGLWLIAILVGISRVYVGVHHLLDVLAAAVIALLGAVLVHVFLERRQDGIMDKIK